MPVFKGELGKKETLKINQHFCVVAHDHMFSEGCHSLTLFFFSSPLLIFFFPLIARLTPLFFFFPTLISFPLIARCFISSLNQEDTAQPFFKLILCLWYHISSTDPLGVCTRTIYPVSHINLSCSTGSILICPMLSATFLFSLLHILIFIHTVLDYKKLFID